MAATLLEVISRNCRKTMEYEKARKKAKGSKTKDKMRGKEK